MDLEKSRWKLRGYVRASLTVNPLSVPCSHYH